MNRTKVQDWKDGVIYKKNDRTYVYETNGQASQGYDSVDDLVRSESGEQATEVQSSENKQAKRSNRTDTTSSETSTDESAAKTTRKSKAKKSK